MFTWQGVQGTRCPPQEVIAGVCRAPGPSPQTLGFPSRGFVHERTALDRVRSRHWASNSSMETWTETTCCSAPGRASAPLGCPKGLRVGGRAFGHGSTGNARLLSSFALPAWLGCAGGPWLHLRPWEWRPSLSIKAALLPAPDQAGDLESHCF